MEHITDLLTIGEWRNVMRAIPEQVDLRTPIKFVVDADHVTIADLDDHVIVQNKRLRQPEPFQLPKI